MKVQKENSYFCKTILNFLFTLYSKCNNNNTIKRNFLKKILYSQGIPADINYLLNCKFRNRVLIEIGLWSPMQDYFYPT